MVLVTSRWWTIGYPLGIVTRAGDPAGHFKKLMNACDGEAPRPEEIPNVGKRLEDDTPSRARR
jgi:hypothetical protein